MRPARRALAGLVLLAAGFVGGAASADRKRKHRRQGPPTTIAEALSRAEKKLRQAEFFCGPFVTRHGEVDEVPEYYFSACLSAVRSAFYILLDQDHAAFQRDQQMWRKTRSTADLALFKHMRTRRDDDVHRGTVDAMALQKFVDARPRSGPWLYIFNSEVEVEVENPDGTKVRAPVVTGVTALYIDYAGQRLEASTACRQFVELMRDLVDHVRKRRGALQPISSTASPPPASSARGPARP
jgi:hypothetical protein